MTTDKFSALVERNMTIFLQCFPNAEKPPGLTTVLLVSSTALSSLFNGVIIAMREMNSISFKCERYIIMQMKHTKNLNPKTSELGTTLS